MSLLGNRNRCSLTLLLVLCALTLAGCGNSPKEVVKSFISACESHNYSKASKMVYDLSSGQCIKENNWKLPFIGGEETHGDISEEQIWRYEFTGDTHKFTLPLGKTNGTEKYWVSPREAIIDKNNPNKCIVFVFAERKEKSYTSIGGKTKPIPSSCAYSKKELQWDLEKINGKWMITYIGTINRYHYVRMINGVKTY